MAVCVGVGITDRLIEGETDVLRDVVKLPDELCVAVAAAVRVRVSEGVAGCDPDTEGLLLDVSDGDIVTVRD